VVAIEVEEGWLVVEDIGDDWIAAGADDDRPTRLAAGARAIVELQRSATDLSGPMLAVGCPHRPLANLPDAFEAAVGGEAVGFVTDPPSADRRSRAVRATKAAVERLLGLGFPETIIHGDFHAYNAAMADGRVVIIDWSDASIGNPLVDLATWLIFSRDKPDERRAATDAWIEAWAGPTDLDAVRDRIGDIVLAGAAYQVVSYDGIVRALEPATRSSMDGGAKRYFERLEMAIDGWTP
jgi:Ser/Thr protein kinase RdoA (MazF antagonist)